MAFQEAGIRAVVQNGQGYMREVDKLTKHTNDAFGGVEKKSGGMAASLGKVGAGLTAGLTLPILGIGAAAIKMGNSFEKEMTNIAVLTNAPNEQIDKMREGILELSKEVGKSPEELGAGAYFILSSGIEDTSDAMEVLRQASQASAAGLGETKVVADVLTSAINAYGLEVEDASRVTDALVNLVKFGKGEPEEFAQSLGFVLPIASQMGVSIEQVGAVLATMTNQGLDAANAVTALKGIFTQLLSPSDQSKDAFERLGLSIDDVANGVRTNFIGTMEELVKTIDTSGSVAAEELSNAFIETAGGAEEVNLALTGVARSLAEDLASGAIDAGSGLDQLMHFTGLTEKSLSRVLGLPFADIEKLDAEGLAREMNQWADGTERAESQVAELFPDVRGLTGFMSAFGVSLEDTKNNLQGFTEGTGAGQKAFEEWQQSDTAQFELAMANLQVTLTELGLVLLPLVADAMRAAIPLIQAFGDAIKFFGDLPQPIQLLILGIVGLVAALGPLLLLAATIAVALPVITGAFAAFGVVLGVILSPIGLIILGIIALAVIIYLIIDNWGMIADFMSGLWDTVKGIIGDAAKAIVKLIEGLFNDVVGFITDHWREIAGLLGGPFILFATDGFGIRTKTIRFIKSLVKAVVDLISKMVRDVITFFKQMASGVANAVEGMVRDVIRFFTDLANNILAQVRNLINGIVAFFASLPGQVVGALSGLVGAVTGVFNNLANSLASTVSGMIGNIVGLFTSIPGQIVNALSQGLGAITQAGTSIVQALFDGISNVPGVAADFGRQIANAVVDAVNSVFHSINDLLDFNFSPGFPLPDIHINAPDIPDIPHLALGTNWFAGGAAIVGELGPELVNLPRGSQVLDAGMTRSLLAATQPMMSSSMSPMSGMSVSVPITVTVNQSAMDWGMVRQAIYKAVEENLTASRTTSIRHGMPLGSGVG